METINEKELSYIFKHSVANIATQLYNVTLKEVNRQIKEDGQTYQNGYEKGFADGKNHVLQGFPMWHVASADDYASETLFCRAGEFGSRIVYRGQLIKAGWKFIPISALRQLPIEVPESEETDKPSK